MPLNPNQAGGVRKHVTSCLTACRSKWNRARSVKPHLNVILGVQNHFMVLFWGLCEIFWKFWLLKKFWKFCFFQKNFLKILILYRNWILHVFCFHLMYIFYILVINDGFSKIDQANLNDQYSFLLSCLIIKLHNIR